jgi:hypothetical protein
LLLPLLFLSLFREKRTEKAAKRKRKAYKNQNNKGTVLSAPFYMHPVFLSCLFPVGFSFSFASFLFLFGKRKRKEEENNNP